MVQFFQTVMGKRFIEGTMPQIATALNKIAKSMEEDTEDIDTSQFKDPYIRLDIPDNLITHEMLDAGPLNLFVQVKLDDEGVALDIYSDNSPPESLASAWKLYQEMADGK